MGEQPDSPFEGGRVMLKLLIQVAGSRLDEKNELRITPSSYTGVAITVVIILNI
jgi:hypothetical protein